jgi:guanosine-3',5'-bis(diphosphate) 3'-pyrophosphohydrolase
MSTLAKAVCIANAAHVGQFDKGGLPYIMHPMRVMEAVEGEDAKIVAVLHDVLEDTDVTADDLAHDGFSETIITALEALTRRPGESYAAFIRRVAQNPLATVVKIADMRDNSNLARIPNPTDKDRARVAKYQKHLAELTA